MTELRRATLARLQNSFAEVDGVIAGGIDILSYAPTIVDLFLDLTLEVNRLRPVGTPHVAGDFALSGWGAGAAISLVTGSDSAGSLRVTAGVAPAANPTITLTYKDAGWPVNPPMSIAKIVGPDAELTKPVKESTTTTQLTITLVGTPTAALAYDFKFLSLGT